MRPRRVLVVGTSGSREAGDREAVLKVCADLDATLVGAFLNHLEDQRGNGSATRNPAGWMALRDQRPCREHLPG